MSFDRADLHPRKANEKAFAIKPDLLRGSTNKEILERYPKMKMA